MTKVHYGPKDTEKFQEELQVNLDRIDSLRKLYEFCASGEIECYRQEMVMKKLNEEFELKHEKRRMEFCKEILEKCENGTLWEELEELENDED